MAVTRLAEDAYDELQWDQAFQYNLFEHVADPYPAYAVLRDTYPVYRGWSPTEVGASPVWLLSRYADVQSVLRDWERFSSSRTASAGLPASPDLIRTDPPIHGELRGVLHQRFTKREVEESLTPMIGGEVDEILDAYGGDGSVLDAADMALELPVRVTSSLLGLPTNDREWLKSVALQTVDYVDGAHSPSQGGRRAIHDAMVYLKEQLDYRRDHPTDRDLLSLLLRAEIPSGPLSQGVLEQVAYLLFEAGIVTTAALIANTLVLLAEHPEQRDDLRENPDRWGVALEESLRFESPLQYTIRRARADVRFYDYMIPEGGLVFPVLGAANRDERQFDQAETFDIRRAPRRHLAFAEGIHFCLGASLARLEAQIFLPRLLAMIGDYSIDEEPMRAASSGLRVIRELRVKPAATV